MGASSATLRYARSTVNECDALLKWCLSESSRWEDGAALVTDVLQPPVTGSTASLSALLAMMGLDIKTAGEGIDVEREALIQQKLPATVSLSTTGEDKRAHLPATSQIARKHGAEPSATGRAFVACPTGGGSGDHAPPIDEVGYRTLMAQVDEILREGSAQRDFKALSQDRQQHVVSPESAYWFPPRGTGVRSPSTLLAMTSFAWLRETEERQRQVGRAGMADLHHGLAWDMEGMQPRTAEESEQQHRQDTGLIDTTTERSEEHATTSVCIAGDDRAQAEKLDRASSSASDAYAVPERELQGGSRVGLPVAGVGAGGGTSVPSLEVLSKPVAAPAWPSAPADNVRQRALSVTAKYLFIDHYLQLMTQMAAFNVKTLSRVLHLKQVMKSGQWDKIDMYTQSKMERASKESCVMLERGLISFDRARCTLFWMQRNYVLECTDYKLSSAIQDLSQLSSHFHGLGSGAPVEAAARQKMLSDISMWDRCLAVRKAQVALEWQAHERDALQLGFMFVDADMDGQLSVHDVPDLSAQLFSLCNQRQKGRFTPEDLSATLLALCSRLHDHHNTIHRLHKELEGGHDTARGGAADTSAAIAADKWRDEIKVHEADLKDATQELHELYLYFYRVLCAHVFPRLPDARSMHNTDVEHVAHPSFMLSRLNVLALARSSNPMEVEMRLGPYRTEHSTVMQRVKQHAQRAEAEGQLGAGPTQHPSIPEERETSAATLSARASSTFAEEEEKTPSATPSGELTSTSHTQHTEKSEILPELRPTLSSLPDNLRQATGFGAGQ